MISGSERVECPSCGGAGGGPFGRANSAWDDDDYVCPRCEGEGVIVLSDPRPGIVKANAAVPAASSLAADAKRKATG